MLMKKKEEQTNSQNFLWHQVSDEEKIRIKENAKEIMDNFVKALESIKEETLQKTQPALTTRNETVTSTTSPEFRRLMFQNAPKKNKHAILAEKGSWT